MLVLMLAWVVHGVDLGHAVGQVTEQPRPDVGVDAFAGGQEPGDFIHALAETGAVFPQDGGVCVEGGCGERRTGDGSVRKLKTQKPVLICQMVDGRSSRFEEKSLD